MQAKYTAKAEDKISEARGKPAQGAINEEASVSRYNAMKAAAAAAINKYVPARLSIVSPCHLQATCETSRCVAQSWIRRVRL